MKTDRNKPIMLSAPFNENSSEFRLKFAEIIKKSNDNQNLQEVATAFHSTAQSYLMEGQLNNAEINFQKAIQAYKKTTDKHGLVLCLSQYALVLRYQSNPEQAEKLLIEVIRQGKKLGLKRKEVKNWFLKTYFLNLLEHFNEGEEAKLLKKKLEQEWLSR